LGENANYKEKLEKFRKIIDNIDDEIVELLNRRGEIVLEIGKIKKEHNLEIKQPYRELEILERIRAKSTIYKKSVQAIWKEILKASSQIQE
jgi:chorismate mutase/prephenate dehydratase